MGQQQLILLVLATVIVGLAIVVGIQAFTENSARSNADAMMHDAVRIANDAQATVKKPKAFGGVGALTDVDFAALGYPVDNGYYVNLNGTFTITADDPGIVITGSGGDGLVVEDPNNQGSYIIDETAVTQEVAVAVCGPTEDDIESVVTMIGGQGTGANAPTCGG